jgi:putative ABC transport system permease protein
MTEQGRPRPTVLLGDAARVALARPVATSVAALIVAIVCVVVLATTGRTAATEAQVLASVDSVGTRLITVTDTTGTSKIDSSAVAIIQRLDGVDWAFAIGPASDAVNPAIGKVATSAAVPVRVLLGDLPADVPLTAGRAARTGEAIAGAGAAGRLALSDVAGGIASGGALYPVVGRFEASGPLSSLSDAVLVRGDTASSTASVRYMYVLVGDGYDVATVRTAVEAAVPSSVPATVEVEMSDGALRLRETLSGTLGASSRQLMVLVLGTGMALICVTVIGSVASRRRDFGRSRALGASRSAIVVGVLVQSTIAAGLGTLLGISTGLVVTHMLSGSLPSTRFISGLGGLTLLAALLGSLPPAIAAAWQDPVRILRVP